MNKELKHFITNLLIFISLLIVLGLFSFRNENIPKSLGINGYLFAWCLFIFYLVFLLCSYILYKNKAIYHIASYSLIGYLVFLVLILFFLTNVTDNKNLYFTINRYNFNKEWFFKSEYNFTPFHIFTFPTNSNTFIGYIFNIICFIPFGFLIPYIFDTFKKKYNFIFIIILFILTTISVETIQYILPIDRRVDIDDMISNFIGSIFGYIIYIILKKLLKINRQ